MGQKTSKYLRIKASTLVESIIALLILSIGVGMGMMTYLNVIRSDRAELKTRIKVAVIEVIIKTQDSHLWMDEEVSGQGYTIQKTVTLYNGNPGMYVLSVRAIGGHNEILYSERKIISSQ